MFGVIYRFKVKDNRNVEFIEAWKEMTELLYEYESSLGSRLHRKDRQIYIAYAQWPDKMIFEDSGSNLPESASQVRQKMRGACESVEKLFELDVIEDLLKSKTN